MKASIKSKTAGRRKVGEAISGDAEPYYADPRPRRNFWVHWDTKGPSRRRAIRLLRISEFSARGMRPIYRRSDAQHIRNDAHFRRLFGWSEYRCHFACNLDVWLNNDGRIFVRFRASRKCLDSFSFELLGHKVPSDTVRGVLLNDSWVPEILRDEFDCWVQDCYEYPDG